MHTKCIPHFNKRLYTFYIKKLAAKDILVLYSKCIQKFVKMWDTFCIHFVYISCIHLVQLLFAKCIYTQFLCGNLEFTARKASNIISFNRCSGSLLKSS